jgi:hypothetical protein
VSSRIQRPTFVSQVLHESSAAPFVDRLNYFDTVTRQQPDCSLVDVLAEDLLGTSAQKRNPTARPIDGRAR